MIITHTRSNNIGLLSIQLVSRNENVSLHCT